MVMKMKIITLVENEQKNKNILAEHGLSLYVETSKHKLLMDTGRTDAIIKNASELDIDLTAVDTIILSHGHYDHSGGIIPISKINNHAKIIMQSSAVLPHYSNEKFIGIDSAISDLPNLQLIDGNLNIDEELFIFSGISGRKCFPDGNLKLFSVINGVKVQDDFSHEQCLVISDNDKKWLLSGCAHNGIINILDRYKEIFNDMPDYVITGFHMMKREEDGEYTDKDIAVIKETAHELIKTDTIFYSGHCTGTFAFDIMKEIMGDQLVQLYSGKRII